MDTRHAVGGRTTAREKDAAKIRLSRARRRIVELLKDLLVERRVPIVVEVELFEVHPVPGAAKGDP